MQIPVSSAADIGEVIRTERKRQRLRQDDLAGMVQSSHVFLRDVESGKATVQLGRVLRVLEELGIGVTLDIPDPSYNVQAKART